MEISFTFTHSSMRGVVIKVGTDSFLDSLPCIQKVSLSIIGAEEGKYSKIGTVFMVIFIFSFTLFIYSLVYLMYSAH